MDKTYQREIASEGGKAAQRKGTAHRWTRDAAKAAGAKGGHRSAITRAARKVAANLPAVEA